MKSIQLGELLTKLYEENSRYEIGAPMKMMKELEFNSLLISDMEISDEDIHVLIKFLSQKQVIAQIEKIEVNKSSGGKSTTKRQTSSLFSETFRFFKVLTTFIENCTKLKSVTFEQIDFPSDVLPRLGRALSHSQSSIRWVGFHVCKFGGDEGLHTLTPFLAKMHLQVLGLEYCELTDKSIAYVVSIIKAHENRLDSLYWNSTLRVDSFYDRDGVRLQEETSQVYGQGLVALSLNGNYLTGKGLLPLSRVLKMNYWLLGLNLANNRLDANTIKDFVASLESNTIIQSVLLKNNPGFDSCKVMHVLFRILARNNLDAPSEVHDAIALNNSLTGGISKAANGNSRINFLPVRVGQLLNCWSMLHLIEANSTITVSVSSNGSRKHPDESLLTNSSASKSKHYQQGINEDVKTIRSKEKGLGAAYSVFHFLDREPAALQGLKKPKDANNTSVFADVNLSFGEHSSSAPVDATTSGVAAAVTASLGVNPNASMASMKSIGSPRRYMRINSQLYQSFTVPKAGVVEDAPIGSEIENKKEEVHIPRVYPVSPLERRSFADLSQNSAALKAAIQSRVQPNESDSEDLFMTALPPGSPHRYTDPLENAIAPASPMHDANAAHFLSTSAHRSPHTPSHRYSLEDIVEEQQRLSDTWNDNNINNNTNNHRQGKISVTRSHSDERPPSRMSIRPINDILLNEGAHDRYLPMLHRYIAEDAAVVKPPRPVSGSGSKKKLTKRRESSKPPLPNYLRPQSRSARSQRTKTPEKVRSASADRVRRPATAPVERVVQTRGTFGKAERDTRFRSRSQENKRIEAQHHEFLNHSHGKVKSTPNRRGGSASHTPIDTASVSYLMSLDQHVRDLTNTMLHATKNLEEASEKFQRVSQSFNESLQMNTSRLDLSNVHAEALSYMMDNSMVLNRPDTAPNGNVPRSRESPSQSKRSKDSPARVQQQSQQQSRSVDGIDPQRSIQLDEMKSMIKGKLHEYLSSWVPTDQEELEN